MKALLIGSLFAILVIIGGAITFMIIDSANTTDAQITSSTTLDEPVKKSTTKDTAKQTENTQQSTVQNASPKSDAINSDTNNAPTTQIDDSKVGFTLTHPTGQSACESLVDMRQEDVNDAEEAYKDAKKAHEYRQDKLDDLEDGDAIAQAQEEIKEKKRLLDKAETALFSVKEKLIEARITCPS